MTTPGQRRTEAARLRFERLKFYVDCLTLSERSLLAARYLRKVPDRYRLTLLRQMTVAEIALCEVISKERYGW